MSVEPVLSAGDVDRFVLNTCSKRPRSMSGPAPASQERPSFDFKLMIEPPLLSATITDLCNEPLFYPGYMSEEEDMSSDDMSFSSDSANDDFADSLEFNFPELLAEDCTFVEQQCNQAEAVTLVSPGKPKMVRVSKVDLTSTPTIARPSSSAGHNSPRSPSHLSFISRKTHSREGSIASSSPMTPSTPPLEGGSQTPVSCHGPGTPESSSSFFDPLVESNSDVSINFTTPTPGSRLRNPYRMRLPHLTKRSDSEPSVRSYDVPSSALLAGPDVYMPKMMPRGAAERLPTIDVPMFPRNSAPPPPKSSRPWTLRKDTFGSIYGKDQTKNKLRRAESGILPSW